MLADGDQSSTGHLPGPAPMPRYRTCTCTRLRIQHTSLSRAGSPALPLARSPDLPLSLPSETTTRYGPYHAVNLFFSLGTDPGPCVDRRNYQFFVFSQCVASMYASISYASVPRPLSAGVARTSGPNRQKAACSVAPRLGSVGYVSVSAHSCAIRRLSAWDARVEAVVVGQRRNTTRFHPKSANFKFSFSHAHPHEPLLLFL